VSKQAQVVSFLGPPGAGKGTQSERVAEFLHVPRISTGDMLRENIRRGTKLGEEVELLMEDGKLVPDDLVCNMIAARILKADCRNGFILDGFPRTVRQARSVDKELQRIAASLQIECMKTVAVRIVTRTRTLLGRLNGRRVCPRCGSIFNIHTRAPLVANLCDFDGVILSIRPDDREETILDRLRVYQQQTLPLVEHYRERGQLREIDGDCSVEEVTTKIVTTLLRELD